MLEVRSASGVIGERRAQPRYAHGGLIVELHKPGLRGVLERPDTTLCIDFSASGLQVSCARALHAGERVLADLRLFELHIDELECEVCSVHEPLPLLTLQQTWRTAPSEAAIAPEARADRGRFSYGLQFSFARARYMRSQQVSDALRRIGFALKQNATYL